MASTNTTPPHTLIIHLTAKSRGSLPEAQHLDPERLDLPTSSMQRPARTASTVTATDFFCLLWVQSTTNTHPHSRSRDMHLSRCSGH